MVGSGCPRGGWHSSTAGSPTATITSTGFWRKSSRRTGKDRKDHSQRECKRLRLPLSQMRPILLLFIQRFYSGHKEFWKGRFSCQSLSYSVLETTSLPTLAAGYCVLVNENITFWLSFDDNIIKGCRKALPDFFFQTDFAIFPFSCVQRKTFLKHTMKTFIINLYGWQ